MSMDIRSFFTPISKKNGISPKPVEKSKTPNKNESKKRQKSASSSNDDIIPETPDIDKKSNKMHKKRQETKRRRIKAISDSESDQEKTSELKNQKSPRDKKSVGKINKKPKEVISDSDTEEDSKKIKEFSAKLTHNANKTDKISTKQQKVEQQKSKKIVNPFDVFGSEPVKQSKVEKSKKVNTELNIHDDTFEKTLLDLDEEQLMQSKNSTSHSKETDNNEKKSGIKSEKNQVNTSAESASRKKSETDSDITAKTPSKIKESLANSFSSPVTSTPTSSRKRKISEADESGTNQDLERYEKKKHSAMLYQKYLNRSGPRNLGSKWIPKGNANCLKNDSFIITGVLDSLSREDAENLIIEHGGRCVKALSKKVNYMIVGEEAGPAKLEKANQLGTKLLSEDELIDLVCVKSGIKNKNTTDKDNSSDNIQKDKKIKDEFSKLDTEVLKSPNKKIKLSNLKQEVNDEVKTIKKENTAEENEEIPAVTSKEKLEIKSSKLLNNAQQKPVKIPTDVKSESTNVAKPVPSADTLAWVDRYRPTEIKQIIGQQTESSNAKKLMTWLKNWYKNQDGKTKLVKPSPWAKNDNGAYFKAALLSGPPGVGKTTTANVVSKELDFDVVEFNASDTRSKKMLHEEVSQLLKTHSLAGYFKDGSAPSKKHVLLMDEVDGMSGNEDRGGMQELITLIKNSSIPIICMCNDRQHPKVRSLANYCFDLRFNKPRLEQIKGAMMSVCFKEDIDITPDALNEVILGSGMDIRQILNNLSMWSSKDSKLSKDSIQKEASLAVKNVKLGPWEVIRKVFSEEEHKNMSIGDKYDLFFYDYSINPLFVQENYMKVKPHCPSNEVLKRVAYTADSISLGDLVDAQIRSKQSWSLLDTQALFSSVIPGDCMEGHMAGQIDFPNWLGKNSKTNKFKRMLSELQAHMRTSVSGSRIAVSLDYLSHIYNALVNPLVKDGLDGIPKALSIMQEYHLMREDLTNITELVHWPKSKDLFKNVDPKVKAAFTRAYNKDVMLPYAISAVPIKKRRGGDNEEEVYGEEEHEESSEEENDNIDNNPMIKVKNQSAKNQKQSTKTSGKNTNKETKGKGPSKPRSKRGK